MKKARNRTKYSTRTKYEPTVSHYWTTVYSGGDELEVLVYKDKNIPQPLGTYLSFDSVIKLVGQEDETLPDFHVLASSDAYPLCVDDKYVVGVEDAINYWQHYAWLGNTNARHILNHPLVFCELFNP